MTQPLHSGKHPDAHPNADQISTFVEGAASAHQRSEMLAHLAECGECREVVFLLQRSAEPEPEPASRPVPVRWRWFMPLGLMGAALACGITALVYLDMHRRSVEPPSQTAMARPTQQSAPPVVGTPTPSQGAPAVRNLPREEARSSSRARTEAPGVASGGASGAAVVMDKPAAPPAPAATPAPAAEAAPQISLKAAQPAAKNEATKEAPLPVAGRNFARLSGLSVSPALRIEHDRGPADGSSEVAGRVTDLAGAVISGAAVALRDAGGATRETTTDAAGKFSVARVAPGHYDLTVTARGFQSQHQTMDLQPRDVASLETVLPVGSSAQTVTVEADQNSVQTQQAEISDSATTLANELPGRRPVAERVAKGKLVLSIDSAGTLFLSRNGGKSWKKIKPAWTGKVAQLAVVNQAPEVSNEVAKARKSKASGGPQVFQITTDSGAVWISDDGAHWRSR